jgi:hypothetical protein
MFIIACVFFRSSSVPYLETIKPKIISENTINAYIFGFRLLPYSLHYWKHCLSFCKWLFMSIIHFKVIQKYLHKIVRIFSKCFGNSSLICWRSILNSKRHYLPYKNPLVYNKCNLVFVRLSYKDLIS